MLLEDATTLRTARHSDTVKINSPLPRAGGVRVGELWRQREERSLSMLLGVTLPLA